jgi:DNA-binding NarL/FixJ family response regulator
MHIRLVTVDSSTLARLGLAYAVASCPDIELLAEVGTVAEAVRVVPGAAPSVITVEPSLPDGDGLALAAELRRRLPGLGTVLLASAEDSLLFRALETGMSAFVPRSAPAGEVVSAIRHAAVAASTFSAPGLAEALARRRPHGEVLSRREQDVLRLMRDGESIPRMAVAMSVSESTVKTYVARLYTKLHVNNRAQALMTAVHRGLLTEPDDLAVSPAS